MKIATTILEVTCLWCTSCFLIFREYSLSRLLLPLVDLLRLWVWRLLFIKLHWFPNGNRKKKKEIIIHLSKPHLTPEKSIYIAAMVIISIHYILNKQAKSLLVLCSYHQWWYYFCVILKCSSTILFSLFLKHIRR